MSHLHTIQDCPSNKSGISAISSDSNHSYLAYPGSTLMGAVNIFDTVYLVNRKVLHQFWSNFSLSDSIHTLRLHVFVWFLWSFCSLCVRWWYVTVISLVIPVRCVMSSILLLQGFLVFETISCALYDSFLQAWCNQWSWFQSGINVCILFYPMHFFCIFFVQYKKVINYFLKRHSICNLALLLLLLLEVILVLEMKVI